MQILQPSFKLLKTFLTDNPELTQKYVDNSVTAISHLLGPLNVFMRHLLVVQGLDPDSNPGERAARELHHTIGTHIPRCADTGRGATDRAGDLNSDTRTAVGS